MRILGIDPGLVTTGYGIVDIQAGRVTILEAGVIQPDTKAFFEQRLLKIYAHMSSLFETHHPDMVVLEKLYAHAQHPATAPILGHVRGVICLSVAQAKVELVEHSVKRIRKALIGNGNATKGQCQEFVRSLLKIKSGAFKLDISDALSLALGQAHMLGFHLS